MYKNIGLAIAFSPTGISLLNEAVRICKLFNSHLTLIHIGEKDKQSESLLNEHILNSGFSKENTTVIWTKGDPANTIIKKSKESKVDLLIAGALEKETIFKYYIGSTARKIMRQAPCSVLILKNPSIKPEGNKSFYVTTDFSPESERAINAAYCFAVKEKAKDFVLLRDLHIPGLASTVLDSTSVDELEETREAWLEEEEDKMMMFAKELNLKEINVQVRCLYGKEGWESSNLAREKKADIFCFYAPAKNFSFLDRLFPDEAEYTFEHLPSNILIVR